MPSATGVRDHLDGDLTSQAHVAGPVHFAHAAGAEPSGDFIRTESRPVWNRHERSQAPNLLAVRVVPAVIACGTSRALCQSESRRRRPDGVDDVTRSFPAKSAVLAAEILEHGSIGLTITCA